jgi:hypothetical protein
MQIGTDWATLKAFAQARNLSVQYVQTPDTYYLFAIDGPAELCSQITINNPSTGDQLDFETNFMPSGNQSPFSNVQTQFEHTNYLLQMSTVSAKGVQPGQTAVVSVTVPGNFGGPNPPAPGRYIDEGLAWSYPGADGDAVTQIQVVDVNNVTGAGANTVLGTYHDAAVPVANQGWALHPTFPTEIDTLGWYGFIPAGLVLQITVSRAATANTAGNFYINLKWGIKT